jgi:hypothetical protein
MEPRGVPAMDYNNTFILLSPASYYAARRAGAAVLQTLHNYRFLCPAATFLRDGSAALISAS